MLKSKKKIIIYLVGAVLGLIVDRFFKFLAVNSFFNKEFGGISLVDNFFKLNFIPNKNIAFSIPFSGVILNIIIICIIIIIIYWLIYLVNKKEYLEFILLVFVVLGAVSNLVDRLKFGFVIDYLDLSYFTVFNIADIMIVGGVGGLIYFSRLTAK